MDSTDVTRVSKSRSSTSKKRKSRHFPTHFPLEAFLRHHNSLGITSSEAALILHYVRYWWDRDRLPFPSNDAIAREAGFTLRRVQQLKQSLVGKGLLSVNPVFEGPRQTSSLHDFSPLLQRVYELELTAGGEIQGEETDPSNFTPGVKFLSPPGGNSFHPGAVANSISHTSSGSYGSSGISEEEDEDREGEDGATLNRVNGSPARYRARAPDPDSGLGEGKYTPGTDPEARPREARNPQVIPTDLAKTDTSPLPPPQGIDQYSNSAHIKNSPNPTPEIPEKSDVSEKTQPTLKTAQDVHQAAMARSQQAHAKAVAKRDQRAARKLTAALEATADDASGQAVAEVSFLARMWGECMSAHHPRAPQRKNLSKTENQRRFGQFKTLRSHWGFEEAEKLIRLSIKYWKALTSGFSQPPPYPSLDFLVRLDESFMGKVAVFREFEEAKAAIDEWRKTKPAHVSLPPRDLADTYKRARGELEKMGIKVS